MVRSSSPPNHWVERPAASFGWRVEAVAAYPLRSTDEAPGRKNIKLNGVTRGGTISLTIERLALHPAPGKAPRRSSTP